MVDLNITQFYVILANYVNFFSQITAFFTLFFLLQSVFFGVLYTKMTTQTQLKTQIVFLDCPVSPIHSSEENKMVAYDFENSKTWILFLNKQRINTWMECVTFLSHMENRTVHILMTISTKFAFWKGTYMYANQSNFRSTCVNFVIVSPCG